MKVIEGSVNLCDKKLTKLLDLREVTVKGGFDCSENLLTSLEGCPKVVDGSFLCGGNLLTSLEGCPSTVTGNFYCSYNSRDFTRDEVKAVCNVHGIIFV